MIPKGGINMGKKNDSGTLKWDQYEVSLLHQLPDGSFEELLVDEAKNLGYKIPPHSEDFRSGAPSKAQKVAKAKAHTESKSWVQPNLKAPEDKPEKPFDRYESHTWQEFSHQKNFLRRGARNALLPKVEAELNIRKGCQGYYSSLLELTYVFDDYVWAVKSDRRLARLGDYAEVFRRYDAEDNDLTDLGKKSLAEFGELIKELNSWSELFGLPVFTVGVTNGLTKLLMDEKFTKWLRKKLLNDLANLNGRAPEQISMLCRQWQTAKNRNL